MNNDDNYEKIKKDEKMILEKWNEDFSRLIGRIGKKKKQRYVKRNGRLPYGYVIPKNKNILKLRPIVSYFNHPFKKLLNVCSRGIMGMLKLIDNDHYILWKTGDLMKEMIRKLNVLTDDDDGSDRRVCMRAYDIKQFYTNLSHDEIRKAFMWLVGEVRKKRRVFQYVCVPNCKSEKVRVGGKSNLFGWHDLDFDTIFMVISMDLNNAIFKVGDTVLRQKKGVPMGSPLSPVLAIMVAAYYENRFLCNCNEDERRRLNGLRYVDDIIVIGKYRLNDEKDKKETERVMNRFESACYHDDLILEKEEIDEGRVIFLEGEMMISETNDVIMRYKNVNWKNIMKNGRQKIKRYVHWKSFTAKSVKRATVIGALNRIMIHSSSDRLLIQSVFKLFMELNLLEYPWNFLKKTVQRMKGRDSLWSKVCRGVDFLKKY